MADYFEIDDAEVSQDKPAKQSIFQRLRDNLVAVTEGAVNAPRIALKAVSIGAFSAAKDANQTIPSLNSAIVTFQTEQFDTKGSYSPGDAQNVPTKAGYYEFKLNATYTASGSLSIRKNGTPLVTVTGGQASVSVLAQANGSTDYFDVLATAAGAIMTVNAGALFQGHMVAGS